MNVIIAPQPVNHDEIRAACRALQKDGGMPLTEQARQSGVAYKTFAAYISNAYQGDTEKVGSEIDKWLKAREERASSIAVLPTTPTFVNTATAGHLMAMFTYAQSAPDIVVVAGGAGIGKTEIAKEYRRTRPNVHLVTMRPTTSGVHTMLAEIAEVVGVDERSANKVSRAIGRRVQGSNALIILDEAQHLNPTALDEARSLFDSWGVGLALVGNEKVYSRLEGEGRQASLAQLFSRVGMRLTQPKPKADDIAQLIAAWGIDDTDSVRLLTKIAGKPGALRIMVKTIKLAHLSGGVTPDTIRAAFRQLGDTTSE